MNEEETRQYLGYDIAMKDSISLRSTNVTRIWCLAHNIDVRGAEGPEEYARVRRT